MKVLLTHGGSCEREIQQIRKWLEAQNCEIVIFDLCQSSGPSLAKSLTDLIAENDAVIVIVNAELPLAEVQVAILAASAKGKKIVGVQLAKPVLIDALEKFGSASVPFERELILNAICEDRFAWTDEDGTDREEPETERNKCRKQKQKSKSKNAAA